MGVASPLPRGLSTSTHCATTLSFVALLLALAAAATAQPQQQPAPARARPDAAREGTFNNNTAANDSAAANATQHSAPRPSSAVARTGKELFQLLADAGVSLIWLPCDLELSPEDAPAVVELSRNVTVEGGDGSGGAEGGGATEAAAEVAARNGTLQLTTLDFAFLVSKLRLAPGATLTLRRLEVRRATSRISAHMDFMAASPGAAVRFEGTLQHRLVCLPEDMGVYNVITLPPAAEHEDVTAAALAGSAERGGGGGAGAPSGGGAAGAAGAPSGGGEPPRHGQRASETPAGAAAEVAAAEGQGQGRAPPRPRMQQVQLVTGSKLCWRTSPPPGPAPQPAAATDAAGSNAGTAPPPPLPPRTSRQALRPPAPPLGAPAPAAPPLPGSLAPTPAPAPASAPVSSALTEAAGLVKAADEAGRTCASYFVEMRDVRLMTQLMSLANNGGYSVTFINASVVCDMQISRDCMATMGAERCMYDMVSAHDPSYGNAYGALGNASGTAAAVGDPPHHGGNGSGRLGLVVGVSVGGGAVLAAALVAAAFLVRRRRPHWLRVAGSGGSGSSGAGGGAADYTCERRRKHPLASDGDGGGGPTSGGDPPSPQGARGAHSSAEPEAVGAAGSRRLLADLPPRPPSAPAAIVATVGGVDLADPSSSSRHQEDSGAAPGLENVFLSRNLSGNPGSSNPSGQPSTSRGRRGAHALAQACQELLKDPARAEAVRWRLAASRPAPRVQLQELIGSGTFGRVYRGLWQGTVVAVKVLVLPPALMGGCEGGERLRRMAAMEAAVSDMARHPCVVQTYSYSFSAIGGVSISGSGSRDVGGGGGGGGGGAALPRAPSFEGPNPSWGIPAGPPLGCELQLVLEYCDLGTLRQALDRGAFHLPPGPPPERPYGSRSAADVSDGSTDRSYDARPRGGGRGGSGRDGASGGDGGGGGGANGRPRWRYGLVLQVAYDVASGLMHLHSYDIVHGDVKAGNVLLSSGPAASRASSTALSHTPSSTFASARPPPRSPRAPAPAPAMWNARIPAAALEGAGLATETAGGAAAEVHDDGGRAPPGGRGPPAGPCHGAAAAVGCMMQRAAPAAASPTESRKEARLPRLFPAAKRASSLDVADAPSAASGSGSIPRLGSRSGSSNASFPQLRDLPDASAHGDAPHDIAAAAATAPTAMRASTPALGDAPQLPPLPPPSLPAPPSPPSPPSPPKRDNSLDAAPVSTRISGLSSAPSPSGASSAAALPPPPASVAAIAAISTPAASPALAAARTSAAHAPFASAFSVASGVYLDTLDFHSGDNGFGLAAGDIGWMAETEAVGAVAAPIVARAPTGLTRGGGGVQNGGGMASGSGRCSGAGGGGGAPPLELPAGFMAKIADFGLATHLDERHHGTHLSATSAQGTVTHTAPELLLYGHISKHVDMYAYGILLYELLTGERPFRGVTRALLPQLVAVQGLRPELPPDTPPDFRRLAESCWHADPRRRPTFEEVLARVQGMQQGAATEAAAAGGAAL